MKYQALRPNFFSMVGGWRVLGVGWVMGWVGGGGVGHGVVGWVGRWWWEGLWGGGGVGHGVGGWGGGVVGPHDTPMLFLDNLVKKLTKLSKNNMGALWGMSDAL